MRRGALVLALLAALALARPATAAPPADAWLEGYAAAVLERDLGLVVPSLRVSQGVVTVSGAELGTSRARAVSALRAIRGVTDVVITGEPAPAPGAAAPPAGWHTGTLPGGTLFRPLMADPRWPHFSASYQRYRHDRQLADVAAVSFGESFTFYRDALYTDATGRPRAWWEVGVQASVFALFDLDAESKDLVNADYFVAFPLSLRAGDWSAILRLFHQSSHLGDEFLLRTRTERVNLSYESVDVKVSHEFGDVVRVYAGGGYLFDQEPASLEPWSVQYGLEFISPWPERRARWRPVAAADLQHREENGWSLDLSVRAGIELDGVLASRNLQILLEYFRGHSPNGQFYKDQIEYLGLGAHFHF
jgi:hypothetical protein